MCLTIGVPFRKRYAKKRGLTGSPRIDGGGLHAEKVINWINKYYDLQIYMNIKVM